MKRPQGLSLKPPEGFLGPDLHETVGGVRVAGPGPALAGLERLLNLPTDALEAVHEATRSELLRRRKGRGT